MPFALQLEGLVTALRDIATLWSLSHPPPSDRCPRAALPIAKPPPAQRAARPRPAPAGSSDFIPAAIPADDSGAASPWKPSESAPPQRRSTAATIADPPAPRLTASGGGLAATARAEGGAAAAYPADAAAIDSDNPDSDFGMDWERPDEPTAMWDSEAQYHLREGPAPWAAGPWAQWAEPLAQWAGPESDLPALEAACWAAPGGYYHGGSAAEDGGRNGGGVAFAFR